MPAVRRTRTGELFWRIHPVLYRLTGGLLGGRIGAMPVLLLTTTGRKSGQVRSNALMYLPHGDSFVVIASFAGEPHHPAWWLNLRAQSSAEVRVGRRRVQVRAREATGGERDRLWHDIVDCDPSYAEYQRRTERTIPVVVLDPD